MSSQKRKESKAQSSAAVAQARAVAPTPMDVDEQADSSAAASKLPEHLEKMRTRIGIGPHALTNVRAIEDPRAFQLSTGVDAFFSLEDFKANFSIIPIKMDSKDLCEFDLVGCEAPVANAFRRILLAEIPTMAIESVHLYQNTSIIPDEVLAHRLGLVPINADPRLFKSLAREGDDLTEDNTIVFSISVACPQKEKRMPVRSSALKWFPIGDQATRFPNGIAPTLDDILLAKLTSGQSIEADLYCHKGVGKDHAKFSPVGTASYRRMPDIEIIHPDEVKDELAEKLVAVCPAHVFDIEDLGGEKRAKVSRPRNCTTCRECVRHADLQPHVEVRQIRNHFLFSIESTGIYDARDLFVQAVKVFRKKCQHILAQLDAQ